MSPVRDERSTPRFVVRRFRVAVQILALTFLWHTIHSPAGFCVDAEFGRTVTCEAGDDPFVPDGTHLLACCAPTDQIGGLLSFVTP